MLGGRRHQRLHELFGGGTGGGKLGFNFPLDGPKTMNGLVLEHFEGIPEPGTGFKIGHHAVEILQTHDRIVKSVRIVA